MQTPFMKRILPCLAVIGYGSCLPSWAEPLLEGRVRLPSGQPAAGVQVMLFDLTDLRQTAAATTDESGWFALSPEDQGSSFPERFHLGQNYPNPFNPSTIIPYQLPASTDVRLKVFNLLGQRVVTLVDQELPAGSHTARWDGTDAAGRAVGAGVYLYRLQGGGMSATLRMVLIDGQAGIPAPGVSAGGIPQEDEGKKKKGSPVHGLTVSGPGLVTYVDPAFRVEAGMEPVDFVVKQAGLPRGKVAATGLPGDVDNNGRVDVVDALLVVLYILDSSIAIPNNGDISRGDVNSDGRINATDLWLILTNYVLPETGSPVTPSGKMYWTAEGPPRIQRANLDGSNVEDLVTSGLINPRGLALDVAGGKMYWLDRGTDKLERANLDGSNVEDLVTTGLLHPLSLALDVSAGKIYWLDHKTQLIQRANLDGSDIEDLVITGRQPEGLALDVTAGKMYWMTVGTDRIQRANLDGSNVEDLVTTGLDAPSGMALDMAAGKMYWTDQGTHKVQRANLDGSNVEDLVTTGLGSPEELALDVAAGKMYWVDGSTGKIQRANLDGSRVEDLVVTGPNGSYGLALDIPTAGGQAPGTATLVPDPSTVFFENDGKWRAFTVQAGEPVVVVANPGGSTPRVESADSGAASDECPAESEKDVERQDGETIYLAGCAAGSASVELRRASDQTLLRTYTFTIEEAPPVAPGTGMSKIYWTSSDRIQRANRDGSHVENLVTFGSPRGLALDMQGGRMYWTDQGARKIWRADLDGSQVEGLITFGLISPVGLALDVDAGKIYWTDSGSNKIQRADLDGSRVENIVSLGLHSPEGLALDTDGGKIYWTDYGTNKIQRGNLDGSQVEDLVTTGLSSPEGLALDVKAGKIYWADYSTDKIQRANLDGTDVEDLVTTGLSIPKGLALDVEAGKIYWTDSGSNKIQRGDLDGTDVEDLLTSELRAPLGLALDSPVASLTPDPFSVTFSRDGSKHRFTVQASEAIDVVANPTGTTPRILVAESSSSFNECPAEPEDRMTRQNGQTVYLAGCGPGQAALELRRASDQAVLRTYTFNVSGAVKMYWIDADSRKIQRANLDGSNVEDLVTGLNLPLGIALDVAGGKMYWTDKGTDIIHRADLDGSNVEDLVTGLREPRRVALDLAGGKIYWADATTDKIQRADLDGSHIEDLVTGLAEPRGLALDVSGGKMYWTDRSAKKIQRANLDGSHIEDLITELREPVGLTLDVAGRKIYWADSTTDRIQRANYDGSHIEDLVTTGLREPRGLALDLAGGKIYWADNGTDSIKSANLDGSHVQDIRRVVTPIGDRLGYFTDRQSMIPHLSPNWSVHSFQILGPGVNHS